jgi:hypothetical protein
MAVMKSSNAWHQGQVKVMSESRFYLTVHAKSTTSQIDRHQKREAAAVCSFSGTLIK